MSQRGLGAKPGFDIFRETDDGELRDIPDGLPLGEAADLTSGRLVWTNPTLLEKQTTKIYMRNGVSTVFVTTKTTADDIVEQMKQKLGRQVARLLLSDRARLFHRTLRCLPTRKWEIKWRQLGSSPPPDLPKLSERLEFNSGVLLTTLSSLPFTTFLVGSFCSSYNRSTIGSQIPLQ